MCGGLGEGAQSSPAFSAGSQAFGLSVESALLALWPPGLLPLVSPKVRGRLWGSVRPQLFLFRLRSLPNTWMKVVMLPVTESKIR